MASFYFNEHIVISGDANRILSTNNDSYADGCKYKVEGIHLSSKGNNVYEIIELKESEFDKESVLTILVPSTTMFGFMTDSFSMDGIRRYYSPKTMSDGDKEIARKWLIAHGIQPLS